MNVAVDFFLILAETKQGIPKESVPIPKERKFTSKSVKDVKNIPLHDTPFAEKIIETPREFSPQAKRNLTDSWVECEIKLRDEQEAAKRKKPRPRSARGLRRDILKESVVRSAGDVKKESTLQGERERMRSLPFMNLDALEPEKETISEETFLFEEEPTPRTLRRQTLGSADEADQYQSTKTSADGYSPQRPGSKLGILAAGNPVKFHQPQVCTPRRDTKLENLVEETQEDSSIILSENGNLLSDDFPRQTQVVIPVLRESEEDCDNSDEQVNILQKQLTQSQAQAQQLRIELEMTKKLLAKARRKIREKEKKISNLEHQIDDVQELRSVMKL